MPHTESQEMARRIVEDKLFNKHPYYGLEVVELPDGFAGLEFWYEHSQILIAAVCIPNNRVIAAGIKALMQYLEGKEAENDPIQWELGAVVPIGMTSEVLEDIEVFRVPEQYAVGDA